jgi:uncharacterized membrane protein
LSGIVAFSTPVTAGGAEARARLRDALGASDLPAYLAAAADGAGDR